MGSHPRVVFSLFLLIIHLDVVCGKKFSRTKFPLLCSRKKKYSLSSFQHITICMLQKNKFVLTILFTKVIWGNIAQSLQWQATIWVAWVQFLTVARYFSLLSVQTCSGAHPVSYWMDTEGCLLGVKQLGHEVNHSHPSSAEIKNGRAVLPLPHTSSWHVA
jgi:hypothetical protein